MSPRQDTVVARFERSFAWIGPALLLSAGMLVLAACAPDPGAHSESASGPTGDALAVAQQVPTAALSFGEARARRTRGQQLFLAECSGCHGERGKGDGPAAAAIAIQPRNLVSEPFKFRSTPYSSAPLVADLVETIKRGMPGSAMPAFDFLSEEERTLIAEYVFYLAGIEPAQAADIVALPPEPALGEESIARGREVYMRMECDKCHGESGRGDGPSSDSLKDEQGRKIEARDFRAGLFRRGKTTAELYRTFLTGLPGTPMPSYAGNFTPDEGWELARYVMSLTGTPERETGGDPLALGRDVVEQKQCYACHVIEGRGGQVGPNLDVSSRKLLFSWIEEFLVDPRAAGKIYPFTSYRMPDLHLQPDEIRGVMTLLAHVSEREYPEPEPVAAAIDPDKASEGTLFYVLKCAECHNLGEVIPTPPAKQQGPDLIHISRRLRFDWIPEWVANPVDVYPGTAMVDTNLTPQEIEVVRAFLWKTSQDSIGN